MNSSLRLACLPAMAACLTLAVRLSAADTPTPKPATAAPVTASVAPAATPAAAPAPTPRVTPTPQLPRSLEGVVTQDEFTTFFKFQQGLRDDPEIKALNGQIRGKMNEMLELQKKVQATQQKAIDSNPEIKAIADKIVKGKPKPPAAPAPAAASATAAQAAPTATPKVAPTAPPK